MLVGVLLFERADVHPPLFAAAARLLGIGGAVDAPIVGRFGRIRILGNDDPALGQLGGALQQARMAEKDVAGIGLAARRTAHEQRKLTIGSGLLGQVVVDAERIAAFVVHVVFGHRAARIGGQVLNRRGIGSGRYDNDAVIHRAVGTQRFDDARD